MKKILGTMLVGVLIAGVAFADMSFDYTGSAILGNKTNTLTNVWRNDCLSLGFKNDIAGVVLDFDITDGDDIDTPAGSKLDLDQFYGWLTFGLPVGNLQITSGKWNSRWVSRLNGNAGDLDPDYFESYKPGSIETELGLAEDIDNLTGKSNMSTVLAYTLSDVLPGVLMVKAGLVGLQNNPLKLGTNYRKNSSTDWWVTNAGYVAELTYRQEDLAKFNVVFKSLKENAYAFGAFFSPLLIDKLGATIGYSMGLYSEEDNFDYLEFGIDLRLRYQINDKWSVVSMNNFSGYNTSYDDSSKDDVGTHALWNMISTSYQAGDNIRFTATVQNKIKHFSYSFPSANEFAITPACEIQATDNVTVTTAFDIRWDGVTPYAGTGTIHVPIYVSFSL